jgi:hypothetical protein
MTLCVYCKITDHGEEELSKKRDLAVPTMCQMEKSEVV